MPTVAAKIPTEFDEKCWKRYRLTVPLTPNSVRAIEGITASNQKNSAAMQNPSAKGTLTFIHLSKNKYCAVKTANLNNDIANIKACLFVVTLFSSLPYIENLRNHFIRIMAGIQDSKRK